MPTPILHALPEAAVRPSLVLLPRIVLADIAAPCRAVMDLYANAALRWLCRRGAGAPPGAPRLLLTPA